MQEYRFAVFVNRVIEIRVRAGERLSKASSKLQARTEFFYSMQSSSHCCCLTQLLPRPGLQLSVDHLPQSDTYALLHWFPANSLPRRHTLLLRLYFPAQEERQQLSLFQHFPSPHYQPLRDSRADMSISSLAQQCLHLGLILSSSLFSMKPKCTALSSRHYQRTSIALAQTATPLLHPSPGIGISALKKSRSGTMILPPVEM